MFQKPLLLPWRTTLDNVLLPVEIQRGGNAVDPADRRNALRMLELVRLGDFADAYPHQLSGGMQQRAALARALMCDPDVLLLDEPFGALDELTRDVLNEELIRIWQSKETRLSTVLMVTHSIPEAVTMSDRVIVLSSRPARLIEDVAVACRAPARARRRRRRRHHPPHPRHGEERPMMSRAVAAAGVRPAAPRRLAGHRDGLPYPGISACRRRPRSSRPSTARSPSSSR